MASEDGSFRSMVAAQTVVGRLVVGHPVNPLKSRVDRKFRISRAEATKMDKLKSSDADREELGFLRGIARKLHDVRLSIRDLLAAGEVGDWTRRCPGRFSGT